jgi:hypothetical protein
MPTNQLVRLMVTLLLIIVVKMLLMRISIHRPKKKRSFAEAILFQVLKNMISHSLSPHSQLGLIFHIAPI